MFTIEERRENLKKAYALQGYLVVSCTDPLRIGEILDPSWSDYLFEDQPFQVVAIASKEERSRQIDFLGSIYGERFERISLPYSYKVVTE